MNTSSATPRAATTITIACPWCDGTMAIDDALFATSARCDACATTVDLEPTTVATLRLARAAA